MRRSLFVPLIMLALALGLAACGGGGSSSSGTTAASGGSGAGGAEAAWGKEVEAVMRKFENVAAPTIEQIHTSTSQQRLEPIYRGYGAMLAKLGKELEATEAPAKCEALREEMGEDAAALAQLHTKLGHESGVNNEEFSALVEVQESRIHRYGHDLTTITYRPHC